MSRLSPLRHLVVLALISSLGACTVLPEGETLRIFLLPGEARTAPQGVAAPLDLTLQIVTPNASQALSSARIAVVPHPNQLSSYRGVRWSDTAPQLLRDRLIEAFQQDGRLPSVVNEDTSLYADLGLFSDLRAFQSEYIDGAPQVVIQLQARLVSRHDQRTFSSRRFEVRQPSADPSVESVVEAFGRASDRLSQELIAWTIAQTQQLSVD
ncbi:MAG: ABC-type transport auxiliary lipoprotein family protein [Pseudomonas sp.]